MLDFSRTHYALFGLPERYSLDAAALDTAYRRLQSEVHPDRFAGASDADQRAALQASARVNEAYRTLREPVARAEYLLTLHGIDPRDETDTRMPVEFLERQLERREQAADAAAANDAATLAVVLDDVRAEARVTEARVAAALDAASSGDPASFAAARTPVRELRFLSKVSEDLADMDAALDAPAGT